MDEAPDVVLELLAGAADPELAAEGMLETEKALERELAADAEALLTLLAADFEAELVTAAEPELEAAAS